ncbi:MAG: SEL1-like repeat protein [Hydrogenophaga sp.]|nr:SEL1-like repeat protein [Hydrogenophaga sp.]
MDEPKARRFGWCRVWALLLAGWLLSGCELEGFRLPAGFPVSDGGAVEPINDRTTFLYEDGPLQLFSRFVRVAPRRYAWEMLTGDDAERMWTVTDAFFVPAESGWYRLHWRDLSNGLQGMELVRFDAGRMLVAEARNAPGVAGAANAAGVSVRKLRDTASLEGVDPARLDRFARELSRAPLAAKPHRRVPSMPAVARDKAMANAVQHVSAIDQPLVRDAALTQRMLAYFRLLHDEGAGLGSYGYGRFATNGWGMDADPALARRLAQAAVDRGVSRGHTSLGVMAYQGAGEPADPAKALRHLNIGAEAGDARAFHVLGLMYMNGVGVAKDPARAVQWFNQAAEQGLTASRVALADQLILGEHLPKDDARAVALLDQAVAATSPMAYQSRAWLHEQGRGGPANPKEAVRLYALAAQDGMLFAQWRLGELLLAGSGVAADRAAGLRWLESAAAGGQAQATERLAQLRQGGTPAVPAPQASGTDPSLAAMDRFIEEERKRLLERERQAKANIARIDDELEQQYADRDKLVRRLRESLAPEIQRLDRLRGSGAEFQRQVTNLDNLLNDQPTPAQRRDINDLRTRTLASISEVNRLVAQGVGEHPHALAWRLPNGQLVLPRPDGRLVVAGKDVPAQRVDTATLPRPGDHFIEDRHRMAMVNYEDSWTGVTSRNARIAALGRTLDELVGGSHSCQTRVMASITTTNTGPLSGPSVTVDINKVMRLRERMSYGQGQTLEDKEEFVPLARVDRLEPRAASADRSCHAILLHCTQERRACVARNQYRADGGIGEILMLRFADESRAQRALPVLRELLELARRP